MQIMISLRQVVGLALVAAVCWLPSGTASAQQVRVSREAFVDQERIDSLLQTGIELEEQRRWGEALSHYEAAVREYPSSRNLAQRHFLARLHYDVGRRYVDSSFLKLLRKIRAQQALDLYGEILAKVQTYYVDEPNWAELVQRGSVGLQVAFGEQSFREQHNLTSDDAVFQRFRQELDRLEVRYIRSHRQAQQVVAQAAYTAERILGIPARIAILEYTCAAASSLDDYSAFLTGGQLDEVMSQIEGSFVGLGIELKADANSLLIVKVIPGGPADRGSIAAGERIVSVNGHSTEEISTDLAADMLKGAEGSIVQLKVLDRSAQPRSVALTRRRVDVPSVEQSSIVDSQYGIAYLKLTSFQKKTSEDVEAALWDLHRQGMRSLIVDVRGNPGGLLNAAVDVADKFIANGRIVSTHGRSEGEIRDYRAHLVGTWRVPLVVLIDGDSASASEIFASAVRDHRRGTIVGTRSFGKGSVQGIFPLNSADIGIRLTTAKFFSPNGTAISRNGVRPHHRAEHRARPTLDGPTVMDDDSDAALNAGIEVARQQITANRRAISSNQR